MIMKKLLSVAAIVIAALLILASCSVSDSTNSPSASSANSANSRTAEGSETVLDDPTDEKREANGDFSIKPLDGAAEPEVSGSVYTVKSGGEYELISAGSVVIATGGIGQLYRKSTNPTIATGDGMASAIRCGARLRDIEFIQFHPTGLWSAKSEDRSFLISEAVNIVAQLDDVVRRAYEGGGDDVDAHLEAELDIHAVTLADIRHIDGISGNVDALAVRELTAGDDAGNYAVVLYALDTCRYLAVVKEDGPAYAGVVAAEGIYELGVRERDAVRVAVTL